MTRGRLHLQLLMVGVLLVFAKLAGAAKEVLLARTFGISPLMDAYQFVSALASWPVSIFSAICMAILIPSYASVRDQGGGSSLRLLRSQTHGATLTLCFALAAGWLALCLATPLLEQWSGLSDRALTYAQELIVPMAVAIFCGVYLVFLSAECVSEQRHGNVLIEALPAINMVLFLWIGTSASIALLWTAHVSGVVVSLLVMVWYLSRYLPVPRLSLKFDRRRSWDLLFMIAPLLLAQTLQAATEVIDQFWAARLHDGSLSVIAYANRLVFVMLALGAAAITRTLLPALSNLNIRQPDKGRQVALTWSAGLFGCGLLASAILWPTSSTLVSWVYERGAFGHEETMRVSSFLKVSWLQISAALASLVLIQQIIAERRYSVLIFFAGCNLLVKTVGNFVWTPLLGIEGLAASTVTMQFCNLILLVVWIRSRR